MPPKTGRPTTLTPAVHRAIVNSVKAGAPLHAAAGAAGVPYNTVRDWLSRGRGNDDRPATQPFAAFAAAVDEAGEHAVREAFDALYKAGLAGEWRALEAWLRLMYPRQYGKRITLQVDEVMAAAEEVARELGLEGHAEAIRERAEQILAAAGGGR